jgi:hypothetical protein
LSGADQIAAERQLVQHGAILGAALSLLPTIVARF